MVGSIANMVFAAAPPPGRAYYQVSLDGQRFVTDRPIELNPGTYIWIRNTDGKLGLCASTRERIMGLVAGEAEPDPDEAFDLVAELVPAEPA